VIFPRKGSKERGWLLTPKTQERVNGQKKSKEVMLVHAFNNNERCLESVIPYEEVIA
jgi:hypothetical protein